MRQVPSHRSRFRLRRIARNDPMIKKTLIPALALVAASVALPAAAAQPQHGHGRPPAYADAGGWNSINAR